MVYIKQIGKEEGCIFCKKPKEKKDEKNFILFRGKTCYILMNLFPYNTGHLMIAPYRHIGDFGDLSKEEGQELFKLVQESLNILRKVLKPEGFNVGMNIGRVAGAGYEDHIHVHIVPRWNGDTNFMPVIADTKVIPEFLKETYKQLKPAFEELKDSI